MRHSYSIFTLLSAGISFVAAQAKAPPGAFAVNPNTVDVNMRIAWCRAQRNSCLQLCQKQTSVNLCDKDTFMFDCQCLRSPTPNLADFSQTLPTLLCEEWKKQCIEQHPNDLAGQNSCLSVTCGKQDPNKFTGSESNNSLPPPPPSSDPPPVNNNGGSNQNMNSNTNESNMGGGNNNSGSNTMPNNNMGNSPSGSAQGGTVNESNSNDQGQNTSSGNQKSSASRLSTPFLGHGDMKAPITIVATVLVAVLMRSCL